MPRLKHKPGSRFGRLIIVSRDGFEVTCLCDCGKTTVIHIANLCTGHTSSCGCLRTETTISRNLKHGASKRKQKTPTYECWCGMRKRCTDPKSKSWPDYGGRGIGFCDRWLSFENFLADMGDRPSGRTLERKDNDGHYCKENCVWASRKEQNRNTRRNRFLTSNGKTQTLSAWAEDLGVNHTTILRRLKGGWSVDRAVMEAPHAK